MKHSSIISSNMPACLVHQYVFVQKRLPLAFLFIQHQTAICYANNEIIQPP